MITSYLVTFIENHETIPHPLRPGQVRGDEPAIPPADDDYIPHRSPIEEESDDEESMDVSMVRYGKKEYVLLFLPLCFLFGLLS